MIFGFAVGEHSGEEYRMHLGHIIAPGNEDIGLIDVIIAAHGLVHAETGQKPGHGTGHAQTRIGFQIVGADTAFKQLGGYVAVGNRPLPGPVHGHGVFPVAFDGFLHFAGHQVEGFLKGCFHHLAVFANQRFGDSVLAIQDLDGMITLDAAQPLVDGTIGIALDGHGAVTGNTDQEAAPGAAEPAGRLFPFNPS